jgi:hypothetical protein
MDEEALPRRVMYTYRTTENRETKITLEEVGKDARMLGISNWWSTAINKVEWKLLREARILTELWSR